jgi:hypothetical protein
MMALRGFCATDSDTLYVNHTTVIIASRKPTDAVKKGDIIVIKKETFLELTRGSLILENQLKFMASSVTFYGSSTGIMRLMQICPFLYEKFSSH